MRRALHVSFAANCVLLVVRVAIALISGSLSLVVATLDAVLDVVSSGNCVGRLGWRGKRRVVVWLVECGSLSLVAATPEAVLDVVSSGNWWVGLAGQE